MLILNMVVSGSLIPRQALRWFPWVHQSLDLLASLPRIEGNPYVFPGERTGKHIVGVPRVWEKIRAAVGLEDVSLHTMRHSFASLGVGTGLSLPIVGAILGHSSESMTSRYGHLSNDPVKNAANRIASTIDAAMKGKRNVDNVVELKQLG